MEWMLLIGLGGLTWALVAAVRAQNSAAARFGEAMEALSASTRGMSETERRARELTNELIQQATVSVAVAKGGASKEVDRTGEESVLDDLRAGRAQAASRVREVELLIEQLRSTSGLEDVLLHRVGGASRSVVRRVWTDRDELPRIWLRPSYLDRYSIASDVVFASLVRGPAGKDPLLFPEQIEFMARLKAYRCLDDPEDRVVHVSSGKRSGRAPTVGPGSSWAAAAGFHA